MSPRSNDTPRDASLPPGYDRDDPYEDEQIEDYPGWWRESIELFRNHGMRPYRPPQLADGETLPSVRSALEREHGVRIRIRAVVPKEDDDWEVWVNDRCVATVGRHRRSDGYTEYDLTAAEFEELIRSALDEPS